MRGSEINFAVRFHNRSPSLEGTTVTRKRTNDLYRTIKLLQMIWRINICTQSLIHFHLLKLCFKDWCSIWHGSRSRLVISREGFEGKIIIWRLNISTFLVQHLKEHFTIIQRSKSTLSMTQIKNTSALQFKQISTTHNTPRSPYIHSCKAQLPVNIYFQSSIEG